MNLSQESSPSLTPGVASTPHASSDIVLGKWARFLPFKRSKRNIASSSVGARPSVQAKPPQALHESHDLHEGSTQAEVVATQHAAGFVGGTTLSQEDTTSSTYLQPLNTFNDTISDISRA
ncbi:hypothetical protein SCLCIDRAFT_469294 [Scleroderma citrinum Foug A]|uniref:Uncharacterized protein n=1 Tax=Scleroderma citrinum Foug A TaxID=1036808 RepID=A0A0C2ZVE4_9AGAM|nr:hypothetical protein SCLCIDRAFT_469294 [Scleroderma citrinum Foug A]